MDAFRNQGLKSAIYGTLVIAIGIVFVVQFNKSGGVVKSGGKSDCVVEVRGECVSPRDFRSTMALLAPNGRLEENAIKQLQLRKRIVDGLVERTLLVQDAARLGVTVSDDEMNNELKAGHALVSLGVDTPPFITGYQLGFRGDRLSRTLPVKTNGQFDQKAYNKALRMYVGQGETEFREMQTAEQIAARMRDIVKARVRLAEDEAFDVYSLEKTSSSVKYVKLQRPWFAKYVVPRTKEAVDAFLAAHKDQVQSSFESRKKQVGDECRHARHILVKASHAASDDEKAAARKRIEEAIERVKKGEKFDDVAREVSEDTSAPEGGDLGCVAKGKMVKPFEDAVFALKAGEMSGVVETEYGFHVVKVDAILTGADLENQVKREIAREQMLSIESETAAAEAGKKILAAVAAGKSLDDATNEVIGALVAKIAPPPAKKADKAKKDDKKGDKKDEKKDEKAAEPEAKPKGPMDDPDAPKVEEAKDFTAERQPIAGVDAAAVALTLKKPGDVAPDLLKLDNGYAILQLTERKPATREAFAKERDRYVGALLAQKQQDAIAAYVARLREAAKNEIKVNQAYLAEKAPAQDEPSE